LNAPDSSSFAPVAVTSSCAIRTAVARSSPALTPEKIEMIHGRLLWDDEQRECLLALLLENVGARAAVRLGDPAVWKQAIAELDDHR
jgi:hypothetical protein